jgi:hypothetical protein
VCISEREIADLFADPASSPLDNGGWLGQRDHASVFVDLRNVSRILD